jgi:hypothetical protein
MELSNLLSDFESFQIDNKTFAKSKDRIFVFFIRY